MIFLGWVRALSKIEKWEVRRFSCFLKFEQFSGNDISNAACKITEFNFMTAFSAIPGLIAVKIKMRTSLAHRGVFPWITELVLGSMDLHVHSSKSWCECNYDINTGNIWMFVYLNKRSYNTDKKILFCKMLFRTATIQPFNTLRDPNISLHYRVIKIS